MEPGARHEQINDLRLHLCMHLQTCQLDCCEQDREKKNTNWIFETAFVLLE